VGLDESLAWRHSFTHEHIEGALSVTRIVNIDLQ
jgi:hypothetical protein